MTRDQPQPRTCRIALRHCILSTKPKEAEWTGSSELSRLSHRLTGRPRTRADGPDIQWTRTEGSMLSVLRGPPAWSRLSGPALPGWLAAAAKREAFRHSPGPGENRAMWLFLLVSLSRYYSIPFSPPNPPGGFHGRARGCPG